MATEPNSSPENDTDSLQDQPLSLAKVLSFGVIIPALAAIAVLTMRLGWPDFDDAVWWTLGAILVVALSLLVALDEICRRLSTLPRRSHRIAATLLVAAGLAVATAAVVTAFASDPSSPLVAGSLFIAYLAVYMGWLVMLYRIYDAGFKWAQQRWPAAKAVRQVVGPLIRSLLFGHHHSSP